MRRVVAALSCVLLAACGSSGSPVVEMTEERAFSPRYVTVSVGEEVAWRNVSDESHTVTAMVTPAEGSYFASGGFEDLASAERNLARGLVRPGEDFAVTFEAPGTYEYVCLPHRDQGMRGDIVVEP